MSEHSRKIILLQCRGFGDAVIATGIVNSIGANFPGVKVDILGRAEAWPIFRFNPHVGHYFQATFPIANGLRFSLAEAKHLFRVLGEIRSKRYDLCLNLVGDFRENLIGWLTGSAVHRSLVWGHGHPIRQTIRVGLGRLANSRQRISDASYSMYHAIEQLADDLKCKVRVGPKIYVDRDLLKTIDRGNGGLIVGVHAFARQQCRLWEGNKWRELAQNLISRGCQVWVFGAPTDLGTAREWFGDILRDTRVRSVFGDMDSLFVNLSALDLFVGLDSFSVHAANALNVPSIILTGPNDIRVWAPPTASIVEEQHGCRHHPCYNRPKCIGSDAQYICMRSISVERVISTIARVLESK